jgi:hypothetical protein
MDGLLPADITAEDITAWSADIPHDSTDGERDFYIAVHWFKRNCPLATTPFGVQCMHSCVLVCQVEPERMWTFVQKMAIVLNNGTLTETGARFE